MLSNTFFTQTFDIIANELLMHFAIIWVFGGILRVVFAHDSLEWLKHVWYLALVADVGFLVGMMFDAQLICMIVAVLIYLLVRWSFTRKLLFGSFKKGAITIGIILVLGVIAYFIFF